MENVGVTILVPMSILKTGSTKKQVSQFENALERHYRFTRIKKCWQLVSNHLYMYKSNEHESKTSFDNNYCVHIVFILMNTLLVRPA